MHSRLAFAAILALSLLSSVAAAQTRCDCAATSCQPLTPRGAVVRGRVVEAEGRDANDVVEHFLALVPARAVCADIADVAHHARSTAARADRVQLVILDAALRARLQGAVGRDVSVRGSLSEAITAHHHTPLLLEAQEIVADVASAATPTDAPDSLAGRWRATTSLRSDVSAMTTADERRVLGQTMTFVGRYHTPWDDCATPALRHESVQAAAVLADARIADLTPTRARQLGLDGALVQWTASCGDAGPPVTFYETRNGRVLVGHDGAWFVLTRAPRSSRDGRGRRPLGGPRRRAAPARPAHERA